ncbi:MAG: hypothetical protein CG441_1670 [Methylococcaceae bacterium NSM2-1]|jgi:hypothetical protein|nr:MAG: hypothetical protein CG441_1670 [Methylococcaceae bacterium NSM2-1]
MCPIYSTERRLSLAILKIFPKMLTGSQKNEHQKPSCKLMHSILSLILQEHHANSNNVSAELEQ